MKVANPTLALASLRGHPGMGQKKDPFFIFSFFWDASYSWRSHYVQASVEINRNAKDLIQRIHYQNHPRHAPPSGEPHSFHPAGHVILYDDTFCGISDQNESGAKHTPQV